MASDPIADLVEKVRGALPLACDPDPREDGAHQIVSLGARDPLGEPLTVAFISIDPSDPDWAARWMRFLALAANCFAALKAEHDAVGKACERGFCSCQLFPAHAAVEKALADAAKGGEG